MATRHRFSRDELDRYFDRICLPTRSRVYDVSPHDEPSKLTFLKTLCTHHLCKVPWENLVQHYSWHRTVHLAPKHLYRKIVDQPGRGGYCMEANFFFHLILYSLNFQVYMAGSRIFHGDIYGGWTHLVNLVTIGGTKYMLDGGYGPQGPTCPLPLEHDVVAAQIAPAELRLMHEPIPNNLDQSQKVWVYQQRYNQTSPWVPMYCFVDFEFTPDDVESMNFEPWLNPQAFFTHKVICVRFTTERESNSPDGPGSPGEPEMGEEIDGSITINHNVLKWRRKGKKIVELAFQDEKERVAALKKYFGIELGEEDRNAILHTAAMIGVEAMGNDN